MLLIDGNWQGALISEDGRLATPFFLSQPGAARQRAGAAPTFDSAVTIAGNAPTSLRLLEGARNALVALADAVPDPASGRLAQVLLDVRVLGDQLVGHWLRRDTNGEMLSGGTLTAVRTSLP